MLSVAGAGGGDWGHYPGSGAGPLSPCVISGLGGAGAGGGQLCDAWEHRDRGGGVTSHVTPRDSAHLGRYGTVVL